MISIGNIELPEKPLFLAPMEDITDQSFRYVCKEYGADVMISEFIASEGLIRDCDKSMHKMKISDLATSDPERFRLAMSKLIEWCDETLTGYREQNWHVIFSLTGGFKGVNGFLQAIAMFYAHESVYIFQSSSQLLRIPRLPITIDKEGVVGKHLSIFRRLAVEFPVTHREAEGIPETLLFPVDEQVMLSEWGELVWRQAKPTYYEQELLVFYKRTGYNRF